jgi:hypothetical protein
VASYFNDQIMRAWDDWERETGSEISNPDDFVVWAKEHGRLALRPQDVNKLLRKQVTVALRQAQRMDDEGVVYRAKQCVTIEQDGLFLRRWFDTDTGGTSNLRQKAVRQRRDAIANDVYRAMSDVDHMNRTFPEDQQLTFFADFSDDYAERRAAEQLARDRDDDEDAA